MTERDIREAREFHDMVVARVTPGGVSQPAELWKAVAHIGRLLNLTNQSRNPYKKAWEELRGFVQRKADKILGQHQEILAKMDELAPKD